MLFRSEAGCCEVVMNWTDDAMTRMKYLRASEEVFGAVPLWRRHFFNDQALEGTAYLAISASDPENLKGVAQWYGPWGSDASDPRWAFP